MREKRTAEIRMIMIVFALCVLVMRSEAVCAEEISQYGMLPVYGRDIEDGTYPVEVRSSSTFFRVTDAELTVRGEEMVLSFFIPSTSYSYIYPGSGDAADKAEETDRIPAEEIEGRTRFTLEIDAVDAMFPCAAYSVRRERWYDRDLLVEAASLPAEALHVDLPDYALIEEALDQSGLAPAVDAKTEQDRVREEEMDVWARSEAERSQIKYAVLVAGAILAVSGILHAVMKRVRGG